MAVDIRNATFGDQSFAVIVLLFLSAACPAILCCIATSHYIRLGLCFAATIALALGIHTALVSSVVRADLPIGNLPELAAILMMTMAASFIGAYLVKLAKHPHTS